MLKKIAGLALGAATVGLLKPSAAKASTGSNFILGHDLNFADGLDTTGICTTGFHIYPTLFAANNQLISSVFPPPPDSAIALVGYTNNTNDTASKSNLYGVYGQAVDAIGSSTATGVFGFGTNFGIRGSGATGVTGNGTFYGVVGVGDQIGVIGQTTSLAAGIGGSFAGGRAAINTGVGSAAVADPNVTNPAGGFTGDLYCGSTNGSLWYRTDASTGSYRRLADNTTAGALTAFPASSRFVNYSHLIAGATGTYQIGGVTVTGNTLPAKARAIIGRIADANPSGSGVLLVGATNPPNNGVIAIVAGAPQNTFFFSALDATGKLYVKNSSASGAVDVIIDIQGYYE